MSDTAPVIADWVALMAAPGVGPRTAAGLLERFGSPAVILAAARDELRHAGLRPEAIEAIKQPNGAVIEQVLSWLEQPGAHAIVRSDPRYPPRLGEIPDAPMLLYVRGDPSLLAEPQIAIVGTRNPTPNGIETTHDFAQRLTADGLLITSGLALGVDGAAHEGALAVGRTIAVLGTGPDLVYPAVHRHLARRIADQGALVSEYLPGQGPLARHFPRRNRIISGLSVGVLVTEAALKSGSLITARYALEQGREVFAVPGSIRNPMARGCHALIRDGARLVEEPSELVAELAPLLRDLLERNDSPPAAPAAPAAAAGTPSGAPSGAGLDADYLALLEAMGFDPVAPDELILRSGRSAREVSSMLLVLELGGHVSSLPGGRFCRLRA
ncbi:DNA-protecting protein DprA [Thiocapsa imhoffii]|uniref:DNA-protecting protein DprA n=1 Tax=Thiocapsa imhoffii TaxID=382777 RepID=A0A9X0WJZ2_9GAMM|nr:DNA-processing protein DprA [Thiocapsa imhoffii]MBK1645911.1 DNA-protecting protein DprA [Thiocapsa imhoffii]